ncbi:MAG: hypothetical protein AB1477_08260 [Acidobacteriota bacterium]|jgi:hypothetical protein
MIMILSGKFKQVVLRLLLALTGIALLISLSCGKRTPPVPPKEKVQQRIELTGFQRGNNVILSWKMPLRNAAPGSVANIARADIYRLAEPLSAPESMSEEEFASRSLLIAAYRISDNDFGGKTLQFVDSLTFAGQPVRLRYAVRFVNSQGQKAAFSNFLLIEPTGKIAGRPESVRAEVTQNAIRILWTPPENNIDGTTPPNIRGYNIYRSESKAVPAKLLTPTPVNGSEFDDEFFEFGKTYFYFVRAISTAADGSPVESSESEIIEVKPVDVFPPSAPTSITIAASPNAISLFFPVNPENDVVGYLVFRSNDSSIPMEKWQVLTAKPINVNTYKDEAVEPGKTYFYYVKAVDKYGNVSSPSQIVSEKLP